MTKTQMTISAQREAPEGSRKRPQLDDEALRNLRVFFEILTEWVENDRGWEREQTEQECSQCGPAGSGDSYGESECEGRDESSS